jgi:hypothetical protein
MSNIDPLLEVISPSNLIQREKDLGILEIIFSIFFIYYLFILRIINLINSKGDMKIIKKEKNLYYKIFIDRVLIQK